VSGHSMEPTLRDGDWLLVDPEAFLIRAPRPGELVVMSDPRDPRRIIVKRVRAVDADGTVRAAGDHPAHASEGDSIGAIGAEAVLGKPWLRYWPLERAGPIG
jgi:signal peptidase I